MADNEIEPDNVWYDTLDTDASPGTRAYGDTKFDQHGYYRQNVLSLSRSPLISQDTLDDVLEYVATMESFQDAVAYPYDVNASRTTTDTPIEYDKLRRFFGWILTATIKHTFDCTTRWARYSGRFASTSSRASCRYLSQLIPFSLTLLPLIMVPPAHKSSLAWIPSSQMPTA